jgi:hypothetical protein
MLKIPYYKAHGGAAVIIRSALTRRELLNHQSYKIEAANIQVDANPWPFTISAIYCPPRHAISAEECIEFFPITGIYDPCGGGVEYLHRDPASRRRRRKGKSQN